MDENKKEIIMEMRKASRFPGGAWHYVTWALMEKNCKTLEETLNTIKEYFIKYFGDKAKEKMDEYGLKTTKDVKDILCMLGEQGFIKFDTLVDSPNAQLWD